jgi:hypothetical protein
LKVTGSTPETGYAMLYAKVITAGTGTHYVAEAAKVIEGNATDTISLL